MRSRGSRAGETELEAHALWRDDVDEILILHSRPVTLEEFCTSREPNGRRCARA